MGCEIHLNMVYQDYYCETDQGEYYLICSLISIDWGDGYGTDDYNSGMESHYEVENSYLCRITFGQESYNGL